MKKNLPLYILLAFLIIVNGFFLYNYLGKGEKEEANKPERLGIFLAKELGFDDIQQEQFRVLWKPHHQRMQSLSEDIKGLKDELFKSLSDESLKNVNIDSIAILIGEKEAAKDLEILDHFKQVQELCNKEQKEKFSKIIEDAMRRAGENRGLPPGRQPDGNRPPHPDGDRPPHPDGPPDSKRPPPPGH